MRALARVLASSRKGTCNEEATCIKLQYNNSHILQLSLFFKKQTLLFELLVLLLLMRWV